MALATAHRSDEAEHYPEDDDGYKSEWEGTAGCGLRLLGGRGAGLCLIVR